MLDRVPRPQIVRPRSRRTRVTGDRRIRRWPHRHRIQPLIPQRSNPIGRVGGHRSFDKARSQRKETKPDRARAKNATTENAENAENSDSLLDGTVVGDYEADLVVEDCVLLKIKVVKCLNPSMSHRFSTT